MTDRSEVEQRLSKMGLELPSAPRPVAEYLPVKRVGDLVYVSGQGPFRSDAPVVVGRVDAEVSVEQGYEAAKLCALNCLAAVRLEVDTLGSIAEIVQVVGFVNSSHDFHDQPKVVNGASELLVKLFGERGRHARAALGTSNLPMNIPVEIMMLVRVCT